MHRFGRIFGFISQGFVKIHRHPAAALAIEQGSGWNFQAQHFFQTQSLGAKLDGVRLSFLKPPSLVFHRERSPSAALSVELHHIGLSAQAQRQGTQLEPGDGLDIASRFRQALVGPVMENSAFRGQPVFRPKTFQMYQGALPGADQVMLKGGDGYEI